MKAMGFCLCGDGIEENQLISNELGQLSGVSCPLVLTARFPGILVSIICVVPSGGFIFLPLPGEQMK